MSNESILTEKELETAKQLWQSFTTEDRDGLPSINTFERLKRLLKLWDKSKINTNRPKMLPNGLPAWTTEHYNLAADAVEKTLGLNPEEWSLVRGAIRKTLEDEKLYEGYFEP